MQLNNSYQAQNVIDDIHKLLMITKISHYNTKSYADHKALNKTYDDLNDLVDSISEQLIGYHQAFRPSTITLAICTATTPLELSQEIIRIASKICSFSKESKFLNLENLAQELSGIGARLKYLSSLK